MLKKQKNKKTKRTIKPKFSKDSNLEYNSLNRKALWKSYEQLEMQTQKAWKKLRRDIERKAPMEVLINDRNQLTLLLGECEYMIREYTRLAS